MESDWFERALAIPGQLSAREMRKMHELASLVPEGGKIVETGSLYGRSGFIWDHGSRSGVTVYCIDPWERAQWIVDWIEAPSKAPRFGLDAFNGFTKDCKKIKAIKGYSPECAAGWVEAIDLYFEDSVHEGPVFHANCDFWLSHLKPGGIFCGHDFRHDYYDIVRRVISTAEKWEVDFGVTNSFFWMQRPS